MALGCLDCAKGRLRRGVGGGIEPRRARRTRRNTKGLAAWARFFLVKNRLGDARSGGFGVFWRWEMKIFGDFFCFFTFFYSFFRKNDEKLAYVFGVRAYLID